MKTAIKYTVSDADAWRKSVASYINRRGLSLATAAGQSFGCVPGAYGQGDTTVVVASGRAVCRCCGKKIAKGLLALRGYDNNDGATYSAITVYVHANKADCAQNDAEAQ